LKVIEASLKKYAKRSVLCKFIW